MAMLNRFSCLPLCVHPLDPLSARCGSRERVREILCLARNLDAAELHDAYGIGRLAVVGEDELGDPEISAADNPADGKSLLVGLTGALMLYVVAAAGSPDTPANLSFWS